MAKVIISPLIRVKGSLQVEVDVEGGAVVGARCSGLGYRGFEEILQGRDPRDSIQLTQRICSEESAAHALAAAFALESLAGYQVPRNGQLLRNLILGVEFLRAHLSHFYLEVIGDYVQSPTEHYWQGVEIIRLLGEMSAIFGGKNPHGSSIVPGGVAEVVDVQKIIDFEARIKKLLAFVENVYLPDLYALKNAFPQWLNIGRGCQRLLSIGGMTSDNKKEALLVKGRLKGQAEPEVEVARVSEDDKYSWYQDDEAKPGKEGAYSWVKAPRYENEVYEVGPLARMMVKGNPKVTALGSGAFSVLGRHLARGEECLLIGREMLQWLNRLEPGEPGAKVFTLPSEGQGTGLVEASGGMLMHMVTIKGGLIESYKIITPSTWNLSPRDSRNQPGPIEQALMGMQVNAGQEIQEIGRVVRSFAPCAGCAAHLMVTDGIQSFTLSQSR